LRFSAATWGNGDLALVEEAWQKTKQVRTWLIQPGAGKAAPPALLFDRSSEDRYKDPGFPLTASNAWGREVLRTAGRSGVLFLGEGASPEGDRPFLDAWDLATRKSRRLFRSA